MSTINQVDAIKYYKVSVCVFVCVCAYNVCMIWNGNEKRSRYEDDQTKSKYKMIVCDIQVYISYCIYEKRMQHSGFSLIN